MMALKFGVAHDLHAFTERSTTDRNVVALTFGYTPDERVKFPITHCQVVPKSHFDDVLDWRMYASELPRAKDTALAFVVLQSFGMGVHVGALSYETAEQDSSRYTTPMQTYVQAINSGMVFFPDGNGIPQAAHLKEKVRVVKESREDRNNQMRDPNQ